jgi:hypothetical protein
MATRHVTHLEKLRNYLRVERRKLAGQMATSQNPPKSFDKLTALQEDFEAIVRAIEDETREEIDSAAKAAEKAAREAMKPPTKRDPYARIESDED